MNRIHAIDDATPIFSLVKAFWNKYSGYMRRLFCVPALPLLRLPD
jgi:hypothetical protein